MATHSPESVLWALWESGSSDVSPHRESSDVVYRGVPAFHIADPTMQGLPCLSLPLFLIIELNGIKSFSIGIRFFLHSPFWTTWGGF